MNRSALQNWFQKNRLSIYWSIFGLSLAFLIFLQYFGLVYYHYPVPPGHDAAVHYNMAQPFFEGRVNIWSYIKSGLYPPGFMILISILAHLFHTDTLAIMLWLTPMIIPLAAIALFLLTKQILGKSAALISFLLYSFAANINIQQLNDGGYPNLIAAQILLPLLLLLLFSIDPKKYRVNNIWKISLAAVILIIIPLTHHLTTLYIAAIAVLMVPLSIIYLWCKNHWPAKKGASYILILIVTLILGAWMLSRLPIFASTLELFKQNIQFLTTFPFIKIVGRIDPEAAVSYKTLPRYIGYPVFIFGILGLILAIIKIWQQKISNVLSSATIIIWTIILLVGSRLTFFTNPDRLARDMVFPLSILAGFFLVYAFKWLCQRKWYISLPLAMLMLIIIVWPIKNRVANALRYEPMVRITTADLTTINYLGNQTPGKILIEAYTFYYHRFLPDWRVFYLYQPQTQQSPDIHVLDPNTSEDLKKIKEYDYLYVVDRQQGWAPQAVKFDIAKLYLNDPHLEMVKSAESSTNQVYLFKVLP